jgi:small subunit ribosomal protein S21
MIVTVNNGDVDFALKVLKRKLQREGMFKEMKRRSHYEKPSERKARERKEAIRRIRKQERKKRLRWRHRPKVRYYRRSDELMRDTLTRWTLKGCILNRCMI